MLGAQYVNFAMLTHSLSEIVFDFAQILPNTPKARVTVRVIMTPTNARLLHKALGESLAKYEAAHGEIKVPPSLADQLFMRLGGITTAETDAEPPETPPDSPPPADPASGEGQS